MTKPNPSQPVKDELRENPRAAAVLRAWRKAYELLAFAEFERVNDEFDRELAHECVRRVGREAGRDLYRQRFGATDGEMADLIERGLI